MFYRKVIRTHKCLICTDHFEVERVEKAPREPFRNVMTHYVLFECPGCGFNAQLSYKGEAYGYHPANMVFAPEWTGPQPYYAVTQELRLPFFYSSGQVLARCLTPGRPTFRRMSPRQLAALLAGRSVSKYITEDIADTRKKFWEVLQMRWDYDHALTKVLTAGEIPDVFPEDR